jgi:hypothetical protein
MDRTRARITYVIIGGTLCLAAWAATAMPRRAPATVATADPPVTTSPHLDPQVLIPKAPPRVEVVFALDTTGSMSGMIDGAKRKIWSLAQFIATGQPKPDLRVGLVAYRDRGDAYVTKFYDLSDDLDEVFEHLQSFEADGGGDGPEDVNRALSDAINKSSWTDGQNALKIIYVVGDAPPHDDYTDAPTSRALAKLAHDRGIRINTVRCGSDSTTQVAFARISNLAAGEFASIDQSGGVRTIATPYDDKLASLNSRLMGTAIGYGSGAGALHRKVAASMAAPAAIAADRASYFGAKGGAVGGDGDLVADVATGRVKAESVPAASLPAEVAAMPAPAREAYVKDKMKEREAIQAEINKVAAERKAFMKKAAKPAADSFDGAVQKTLEKQAESAGLKL